MLRVLEERQFPFGELVLLAGSRSAGTKLCAGGKNLTVAQIDDESLASVDVAFFAAGASVSRRYAPVVAQGGGIAIDKSSAYRMEPEVPLIVPEVNPGEVSRHHGIVSNPNCVVIPLTVVLAPLHLAFGLRHVTLATCQAASGGGHMLVAELESQAQAAVAGDVLEHSIYPHVLYGNVVPGGWSMFGADTEEEVKIIEETRRVLGLPELPISVSTVRVPVAVGHSASVWLEFADAVDPMEARAMLADAPGVRVLDDPESQVYPTPRDAAGTDDVLVGRIRQDLGRRGGISLFFAADNLRKGAATNAVQVAELALVAG